MSKYEDHNNSDYEEDLEQEQIEQEYEKIKHFTQEDYMKCPQTRDILIEDFESRFQETAEDELRELFINNYQSLAYKFSSVLYRADESHAEDFISMIHHHIEKKYNTDIFKEAPHLAKPLVDQLDDIIQKEKLEQQKMMNKKIGKNIKSQEGFVWGKQNNSVLKN